MAGSIQSTETIDGAGFPLAFKVRQGTRRPLSLGIDSGFDAYKVEARALGGHQKEAVVTEGQAGSAWRMVSDEGANLKGTDLAPFPLGFMAAGLQADLENRIARHALARGIAIAELHTDVATDYAFQGSFFKGDGRGTAFPPVFRVSIDADAPEPSIARVVADALAGSPGIALLRTSLANTFALYANGRRRPMQHLRTSSRPDAADPLKTWRESPRPLERAQVLPNLIEKAAAASGQGTVMPATAPGQAVRIDIPIRGRSSFETGTTRSEAWSDRPGGSRFAFRTDERSDQDSGPTGLGLIAAGVAFCFMTQLLRYTEYHQMKIRALRIVQESPFEIAGRAAQAHVFDTHVFVHGEEDDETMERLVTMAANTCYLHAALHAALEPRVSVQLNGRAVTPAPYWRPTE